MKKTLAISLLTMFFASLFVTAPATATAPADCLTVIIVFKEAVSAQDVNYVTSLGGIVKYTYSIIDGVAAELPVAAANKLKDMQKSPAASSDPQLSRIKYIEDDMKMYALGNEGAAAGHTSVSTQTVAAMTVPDAR